MLELAYSGLADLSAEFRVDSFTEFEQTPDRGLGRRPRVPAHRSAALTCSAPPTPGAGRAQAADSGGEFRLRRGQPRALVDPGLRAGRGADPRRCAAGTAGSTTWPAPGAATSGPRAT